MLKVHLQMKDHRGNKMDFYRLATDKNKTTLTGLSDKLEKETGLVFCQFVSTLKLGK